LDTLILVCAAYFGACVGSFLNVCIFRLPRQCLRLWKPKLSFCPKCHRTLPWYENVPIFGYLGLGGKCRGCKASIPLRYFFVELGTMLLYIFLAQRNLVAHEGGPRLWGVAIAQALFGSALIVCALVDWDTQTIPDEIDIPGFLLAPLVAFLAPDLMTTAFVRVEHANLANLSADFLLPLDPVWIGEHASQALHQALPWWGAPAGLTDAAAWPFEALARLFDSTGSYGANSSAAFASLAGAVFGGWLIWAIGWLGNKVFRRPEGAMGFGDVKFMAMIGGFTGVQGVIATIVVAAVVGSFYGIAKKIQSGRPTVTGKDLAETTLMSYWALRIFGAPAEAPDDQKVVLRFGGGLAARFATGEPYLPFGPFLALGAGLFAFFPEAVLAAYVTFGTTVAHIFRP
jgi:leader peptidase (prepilin peptidase)/N-methyltransferase